MEIKHYLNFISSNHGRREIVQPSGFDSVDFTIQQDKNRLARDIVSAGEESQFTIYRLPDPEIFELLIYNKDKTGTESEVKYEVDFDNTISVVGEVDFIAMETDRVNYITFTVMEENVRTLLKNRADTAVNILGNKTIDDLDITPCNTTSVFLPAIPVINQSQWSNPILGQQLTIQPQAGSVFFNVVSASIKYDIEDSLSWLENFSDDTGDNFRHIRASTNLFDINISIKYNIDIKYTNKGSGGSNLGFLRLRVVWGQENIDNGINAGQFIDLYYNNNMSGSLEKINFFPEELTATIPFINTTDLIWINFTSFSGNYEQQFTFHECTTTITATSVAYNTVVPMIRVIDAMKFVAKATCGLNVNAPRYDIGGEFYDQYITTTQLMRRLLNKPVNVKWKDIAEDWLEEAFGDFVIKSDNDIHIGIYEDFFVNKEIAVIENVIDSEYNEVSDENAVINQLKVKYKRFKQQDQVQDGVTNSIVHGETEWVNQSKKASKSADFEIGWVRDPLTIEDSRRKAYDLSDSTATQDDDKIFVIDVVPFPLSTLDRYKTETANIQHQFNDPSNTLTLVNNDKFSWLQLGIASGTVLIILNTANNGTYYIQSVDDKKIVLQLPEGYNRTNYVGTNTTFTYFINQTVTLKARTTEGFDSLDGFAGAKDFYNLRFTIKRIILNYYQKFLASTVKYIGNKYYKNTLYRTNPEASTQLSGQLILIEGDNFTPVNPLVDPDKITIKAQMGLFEFLNYQKRNRDENGYTKTWRADGVPIKGYPTKAVWTAEGKLNTLARDLQGIVEIEMLKKHEPYVMHITGINDGAIYINGDEIATNQFDYEIDQYEKLSIFDANGRFMYTPVLYSDVRVNNSGVAQNTTELQQWLNILLG